MRPYTVKRFLDRVAVEEQLVDRIANPYQPVVREYSEKMLFYDACCSLPEHVLDRFLK